MKFNVINCTEDIDTSNQQRLSVYEFFEKYGDEILTVYTCSPSENLILSPSEYTIDSIVIKHRNSKACLHLMTNDVNRKDIYINLNNNIFIVFHCHNEKKKYKLFSIYEQLNTNECIELLLLKVSCI